jgi:hypothetical protein
VKSIFHQITKYIYIYITNANPSGRDFLENTYRLQNTKLIKGRNPCLPVIFEHTISACEWQQTYALDCAAKATGIPTV